MRLAALLVAFAALLGAVATPGAARTGVTGCGSGKNGGSGYAYAGHQAAVHGHGVRARITLLDEPVVRAGHVAGWVGVGGPGSGPNGEDQWLQVGVAAIAQSAPMLYAEITRAGKQPILVTLESNLQPGSTRTVAVLEMAKHPGWWRVWVGGKPVTRAVRLLGSREEFQPIATAESANGGQNVCNGFRFRFERVGVADARGGSWHPFRPGYDFLDRGYKLRPLTGGPEAGARLLAAAAPLPYAFEASSP